MEEIKENMLCPHCGNGKLTHVVGYEPYIIDHLQCDVCDSTYNYYDNV